MIDESYGCSDGYGAGIGNRMIDVYELSLEHTEVDHVTRLYGIELGIVWRRILVELTLYYSEGEARTVYRSVYLSEHVWHSTDMVLVSVRDKYSAYLVRIAYKI